MENWPLSIARISVGYLIDYREPIAPVGGQQSLQAQRRVQLAGEPRLAEVVNVHAKKFGETL